mmetsp:Transcript_33138/g.38575  ORF Transcript_33138/g.38575 Transcript_33138/m.38575 type:complete len:126 (+) Transcript_33138:304-681(+)
MFVAAASGSCDSVCFSAGDSSPQEGVVEGGGTVAGAVAPDDVFEEEFGIVRSGPLLMDVGPPRVRPNPGAFGGCELGSGLGPQLGIPGGPRLLGIICMEAMNDGYIARPRPRGSAPIGCCSRKSR